MFPRIIITGGRGFVGRYLVSELKQAWPKAQVTAWDLPEVDITDTRTYQEELERAQPDWIVHLAALAAVGSSFKKADDYYRVNVEGTRKLLETVSKVSVESRVLAISSADIYGIAGDQPIPERPLDQARPRNPYAESKGAMEKLIEDNFNELCIRARPFPHIGPGQKQGFVTTDFASQIAGIEKGKQPPVIKVGNLESKRDFTDVRDVARAYRLLMEKGRTQEVYNISSGQAVSIQVILDKLLALSTLDIDVKNDPGKVRQSDNPVAVGDAGKIRQTTGWQPRISLEQSLRDILSYWRKVT